MGVLSHVNGGNIIKGNFGSAVMAPEVFLKALNMARTVLSLKKRPSQILQFSYVIY